MCCRGNEHFRLTEKRWCLQLSLVAQAWDDRTSRYERTVDAPQVRCLWMMSREKRVLLWEELQPQLQFHELGLGGGRFDGTCPMDDKELAILCPKGSLLELQRLLLHVADKFTDAGLQALASAGCGAQLASLILRGE